MLGPLAKLASELATIPQFREGSKEWKERKPAQNGCMSERMEKKREEVWRPEFEETDVVVEWTNRGLPRSLPHG